MDKVASAFKGKPLTVEDLELPEGGAVTPDGRKFSFFFDESSLQEIEIVGEASYQRHIRAIYEVVGDKRFPIYLTPEPGNQYDKNAVKVEAAENVVGYIPRDEAKSWQKLCFENIEEGRILSGLARIYTRDGNLFGVFGSISVPRRFSVINEIPAKRLRLPQLKALEKKITQLADAYLDTSAQLKSAAKRAALVAEELLGHVKSFHSEEISQLLEDLRSDAQAVLDEAEKATFTSPEDSSLIDTCDGLRENLLQYLKELADQKSC